MSTRPFVALVRKDVRVFLGDRRAVILTFAVPLMLASIFASISPGGGGGTSKIPVLVVDEDKSPLSRQVIEGLSSDPNLAVEEVARDEARRRVRTGEAGVAVAVPAGFGATASKGFFGSNDKPELTFYTDPTHAAESGMVRGLLTQHAMEAVSRDAFHGEGGLAALGDAETQVNKAEAMDPALRQALLAMFRDVRRVQQQTEQAKPRAKEEDRARFGFAAPFTVKEEVVAATGQADHGIVAAHAFAGMAVQFILFGSIEAGVGILTERQRGLWSRLRAAPLSRTVVLGARTVSQALISLLILSVMFAFGFAVFQVRFSGSMLGFLLVALGFSLTASTFGLLIAAVGRTPQAARGISIMAVLLMVLLGGAWMPMFLFPEWLQQATLAVPTRWAVDGFEGATWRGLGLAALVPKAAALLGFAALFGGLAVARFRWDES